MLHQFGCTQSIAIDGEASIAEGRYGMKEAEEQFLGEAEPYRTMNIEEDSHSSRQFYEGRKTKDIKQR